MTLLATLALAALLSALCLLWVLAPAKASRWVYAVALVAATASVLLYLGLGRPDMPAHPLRMDKGVAADYRALLLEEFALMTALSKNPDDVDALVRLAAIRLTQGRAGEETLRLVARAKMLAPKDKRVKKIMAVLAREAAREKE